MFGELDPSRYDFFVDNCLCFGLSRTPAIFNRLSNAIVRIMSQRGFTAVVNYLDNFLITCRTHTECQHSLATLISLLHSLGFNISWKKVVSPTQRVTLLGLELDSLNVYSPSGWQVESPQCSYLVFSCKTSANKRQLQSLAGSLNFACHVVHGGHTFLRRVIDCINKLHLSSHRCRLTSQLWRHFVVQTISCDL